MAVNTIHNQYAYKMISGNTPQTIPNGWNEAIVQCVVGNNARCFNYAFAKTGMADDSVYTYRNGYYVNDSNYGSVFLSTQLKSNGTCIVCVDTANIGGTDYTNSTWIKIMYR